MRRFAQVLHLWSGLYCSIRSKINKWGSHCAGATSQSSYRHGCYGSRRFRSLPFSKNLAFIASCQNIPCPITVHECLVYAKEATQIPPQSGVKLPAFVKKHLPDNQDFIFKGVSLITGTVIFAVCWYLVVSPGGCDAVYSAVSVACCCWKR